jgi:hypothetical protein
MSDIHPVAIDSHLLSQVTGGAAKPPTPIADAVNRVRRTAKNVVNRITPRTPTSGSSVGYRIRTAAARASSAAPPAANQSK